MLKQVNSAVAKKMKIINTKEKFLKYEVYLKNKKWKLGYKNEKGVVEYIRNYSTQKEIAQEDANEKNKRIENDDFKEEFFQFDKAIDIYDDYVDEHYPRKEGEGKVAYEYRLEFEEPKKDSKFKKLIKEKENRGKEYFSEIIYRDAYNYFSKLASSSGKYLQIEAQSIIYNFCEYMPVEIKYFLCYIWEDDDKQKEELVQLIKEEIDNALSDLGYKYIGKTDVLKSKGYEVNAYRNIIYSDVYKKVKDK